MSAGRLTISVMESHVIKFGAERSIVLIKEVFCSDACPVKFRLVGKLSLQFFVNILIYRGFGLICLSDCS